MQLNRVNVCVWIRTLKDALSVGLCDATYVIRPLLSQS